jgi:hypothetical protein
LIGEKTPHVCEKEWLDIWKGFLRRPEVRQEEP